MKKNILLVFLLAICYPAMSQIIIDNRTIKEYEKRITKMDVVQYVNFNDEIIDPSKFWQSIYDNHEILNKWKEAIRNGKKLAKETISDCETKLTSFQNFVNTNMTTINDEELNKIYIELVCGNTFKFPIKFNFIEDHTQNAWVYPDGNIFITSGLAEILNGEQLIGIAAHEMAHYIIKHAYINEWEIRKNELKNIIAAAALISTDAVVSTWAGAQGLEIDVESKTEYYDEIIKNFAENIYLYQFKNSRQQEFEADLIAIRFLEYVNIDPKEYIKALQKLGTNLDKFYNEESDHPTTFQRINFLNYVLENHSIHKSL